MKTTNIPYSNSSDPAAYQSPNRNVVRLSLESKIKRIRTLSAKISKIEHHCQRLENQVQHCRRAKRGRSKKESLKTQIDVYAQMIRCLKKEVASIKLKAKVEQENFNSTLTVSTSSCWGRTITYAPPPITLI